MPETDMIHHPTLRGGRQATLATALLVLASACSGSVENVQQATAEGTQHICSSCHGPDGKSTSPTFPRLAGQQKDYLEAQLKAFRDHTRADPHAHTYMWGMAAKLSDDTIDGLANFYSAQKPVPGSPQNPVEVTAGIEIFDKGVPDNQVPPCMACHGDKAQGNGAIPRLAGQHRDYLEEQLAAFSSNARANPIMHETSQHLTNEQIDQVASYLAAQ
jgi:cytochrome c553